MSNKCLNWAWRLPITPGPKLVLICLADMANDNGFVFPKQSTIAEMTGYERSTVNRHIQYLIKKGILCQEKQKYKDGRFRSSTYQLNINQDFFPCAELPHGQFQHHHVAIQHNRIPHGDPLLIIGGLH